MLRYPISDSFRQIVSKVPTTAWARYVTTTERLNVNLGSEQYQAINLFIIHDLATRNGFWGSLVLDGDYTSKLIVLLMADQATKWRAQAQTRNSFPVQVGSFERYGRYQQQTVIRLSTPGN
jgi:hypothetical protein